MAQPLLKKPNLDTNVLSHLRPISKLPFLSKILEKVVYHPFLNKNDISEALQSGFREQHSTESALLKVYNDLLLAADNGDCAILILLDLGKMCWDPGNSPKMVQVLSRK